MAATARRRGRARAGIPSCIQVRMAAFPFLRASSVAAVMAAAEKEGLSIYLHGGEQQVLDAIIRKAGMDFPNLRIA